MSPGIGLHCGGRSCIPPGAGRTAEPGLVGYRMLWESWWSCPRLLGIVELAVPGPSCLTSKCECWHCLAVPAVTSCLPGWGQGLRRWH